MGIGKVLGIGMSCREADPELLGWLCLHPHPGPSLLPSTCRVLPKSTKIHHFRIYFFISVFLLFGFSSIFSCYFFFLSFSSPYFSWCFFLSVWSFFPWFILIIFFSILVFFLHDFSFFYFFSPPADSSWGFFPRFFWVFFLCLFFFLFSPCSSLRFPHPTSHFFPSTFFPVF